MIFEAFLGYDDFEIRGTTFLRAKCMSCVFLPVIAYWNRPTNTWVVLLAVGSQS